jgi:hypothetical protein
MNLAVYRDYERKMAMMADQGSWPLRSADVLLPDDWIEANDRLLWLHARVFDDELKMLVEHFRDVASCLALKMGGAKGLVSCGNASEQRWFVVE